MDSNKLPQRRIGQALLVILVLALVHFTGPSLADIERNCDHPHTQRAHRRGLCGPQLATFVDTLCRVISQQLPSGKIRIKRRSEKEVLENPLQAVSLQPKDALSYLRKRSVTGTIICECCYNQCSLREMAQYCDIFGKKKRDVGGGLPSQAQNAVENPLATGYY